ncbi:MAG: Mth938-like domain-containing protein [Burkholderiales bacterium]
MKLHLAQTQGRNSVSGYGPGYIVVNGNRYEASLVVLPDKIIERWGAPAAESLDEAALRFLATLGVEIVLIGTGKTLKFPEAQNLRWLIEAGIGFEIMDTNAACRTYNILVAEDRKVAAALQL